MANAQERRSGKDRRYSVLNSLDRRNAHGQHLDHLDQAAISPSTQEKKDSARFENKTEER